MNPKCKNCTKNKPVRPRGLCWKCYYTPGVKDLYPPTSKFARRGEGFDAEDAAAPEFSTRHLPGTPGKVNVLIQRCRMKRSLWHPRDAQKSNV